MLRQILSIVFSALAATHPAVAQSLTRVANLTVNGSPLGIANRGNTAYLTNFGDNTFQAYNVANSASPALLSTNTTNSTRVRSVVIGGTTAYVLCFGIGTTTSSELRAIDVSVPTAPVLGPLITLSQYPVYIAASSTRVCVASGLTPTLQVYDSNLTLLSTVSTTSVADNVTVTGTTAYLQRGSQLDIYDLSIPGAPVRQTTITGSIGAVSGTLAYGLSGNTLTVYDVSNSLNPVFRGSATTNGGTLLAASGATVFTTGFYAGGSTSMLQAFDASNPVAPVLRATASAGSTAAALAASGNTAYLVNGYTLQVYTLTGTTTATSSAVGFNGELYPSPAHTTVTFTQMPTASPISIYDQLGRLCLSTVLPASGIVNISALPAGCYVVRMGEIIRRLTVE